MTQCVAGKLIEAKRPGSLINISSQMAHGARRTAHDPWSPALNVGGLNSLDGGFVWEES